MMNDSCTILLILLIHPSWDKGSMPIHSKMIVTNELAVIGHLKPDTDSVAAAIGYARWLEYSGINAKPYRLGDLNRETQFVLRTAGTQLPDILPDDMPNGTEVALVDHNEISQSMNNLIRMNVTHVIDHHKLGDLTTSGPIYLRFEPVGCTSTILTKLYLEHNVPIDRKTATLLLSAIISDTLYFRSSTTTQEDRDVAKYLQPISEIFDIEHYAQQLFEAKSNLTGLTIQQILLMDYKKYNFKNQTWGVGVIETWHTSSLLELKDEFLREMAMEKQRNNLTGILFSIVDIRKMQNLMLVLSQVERIVIEAAYKGTVSNHMADLGPRISRKKDIVQPLEIYFNEIS